MRKCGSENVNWMCTQLFGLADLLQSGYGTCFVRISCFFELIILVKHWFSRKLYFSGEFTTKSHNQNDRCMICCATYVAVCGFLRAAFALVPRRAFALPVAFATGLPVAFATGLAISFAFAASAFA